MHNYFIEAKICNQVFYAPLNWYLENGSNQNLVKDGQLSGYDCRNLFRVVYFVCVLSARAGSRLFYHCFVYIYTVLRIGASIFLPLVMLYSCIRTCLC